MISFTTTQLDSWIALIIYPLARILALLATAPAFNNAALPARMRLMIGIAISLALAPALAPMPNIPPGSWQGIATLAQQIMIGIIMGFTLRIIFSAIDLTGELVGLQMGLSFATFYDPQSGSQSPVISEFLGLLATLMFLAMNGHLLTLSVIAESFQLLPVSTNFFAAKGFAVMLAWSATIFSTGLMLALPIITALMIANIALGILARVAPALNIFAIGFPITLVSGFTMMALLLPAFGAALERLYSKGFITLSAVLRAGGALP